MRILNIFNKLDCSYKLGNRYILLVDEFSDLSDTLFENYTGDVDSAKYLKRKAHVEKEETALMLRNQSSFNSRFDDIIVYVIKDIDKNEGIGMFTLIELDGKIELHFGIGRKYRRRGIVSGFISIIIGELNKKYSNYVITSYSEEGNYACSSMLNKLGFSKVKKSYSYVDKKSGIEKKCLVFEYS